MSSTKEAIYKTLLEIADRIEKEVSAPISNAGNLLGLHDELIALQLFFDSSGSAISKTGNTLNSPDAIEEIIDQLSMDIHHLANDFCPKSPRDTIKWIRHKLYQLRQEIATHAHHLN